MPRLGSLSGPAFDLKDGIAEPWSGGARRSGDRTVPSSAIATRQSGYNPRNGDPCCLRTASGANRPTTHLSIAKPVHYKLISFGIRQGQSNGFARYHRGFAIQ
jgi:hypothetical protein